MSVVARKDLAAATNLLQRFNDRRLTLADAVGLHVMARQDVRTVWSTDRHLGLTGATLAIHDLQ